MITTFLSNPIAREHVPDEFWSITLQEALIESIKEFRKYDEIDGALFLNDLVGCLVPLAISNVGSNKLVKEVVSLVDEIEIGPQSLERVLLFFKECG